MKVFFFGHIATTTYAKAGKVFFFGHIATCCLTRGPVPKSWDNMQVYDPPKPPVSSVFGCEEAVWKKDFSQRNPKTRSKVVFKNADLLGQFAAEDHDDKGHSIPPVELNGTGWMCRRVRA